MTKVNRPLDSVVSSLIEVGAPIADAVRIGLWRFLVSHGLTSDRHARGAIPDFAEHFQLDTRNFAASIYSGRPPTPAMTAALIEAMGGTPEEWRHLLWRAARPLEVAAAATA